MQKDNSIDFVLMWVDGNDPEWLKDFHKYAPLDKIGDKKPVRFRDWENLQYWFRAIEKFAPWVNRIHLVTYGHVPQWLDTSHPKLNIVNHKDIFINASDLPTFNSRAIEVNLHRIPGLAEQFVYFNDDMFLVKPTSPLRFFKKGKPVDVAIMNTISPTNDLAHILIDNLKIISKYFNKYRVLKIHFHKWFNLTYGLKLVRTLALLPWPNLTGFFDPHQPTAFLKSTFNEVWENEEEILNETSKAKFKCDGNVNQYLFRYWQLAKGTFSPLKEHDMFMFQLVTEADCIRAAKCIQNQKYRLLCLNDSTDVFDFEQAKKIINRAFQDRFSDMSSYEKLHVLK